MEKTKEAIADANKALKINSESGKAIVAKAEAFYSSGNFEKALVHFVRANRLYRTVAAAEGVRKAERAILDLLDRATFSFDTAAVEAYFHAQEKERMKALSVGIKKKRKSKRVDKKLKSRELISEEERFLLSLKNMEDLNVDIQVKVGTKKVYAEVVILDFVYA